MKIIASTRYCNLIQRVTNDELVKASIVDLESFPVDNNPFRHDLSSMGTRITKNWMVMHHDHTLNGLYLVNTKTGQRIGINTEPQKPTYQDVVYIGDP